MRQLDGFHRPYSLRWNLFGATMRRYGYNDRSCITCLRHKAAIVLTLLSVAAPALSEVQLSNGMYAGTIEQISPESRIPPVHFFVQTPFLSDQIKGWVDLPEHRAALESAGALFDQVAVVAHPEAILGGEINRNLASYASSDQLALLDRFLSRSIEPMTGCAALPFVLENDGKRMNILMIYVFSADGRAFLTREHLTACLAEALSESIGVVDG